MKDIELYEANDHLNLVFHCAEHCLIVLEPHHIVTRFSNYLLSVVSNQSEEVIATIAWVY